MTTQHLEPAAGLFAPIDVHFSSFMQRLCKGASKDLALAAALLSRVYREGHTCLDLCDPLSCLDAEKAPQVLMDLPGASAWIEGLRGLPVVGPPGSYRPLILDGRGRLYLHRAYEDERMLAEGLLGLSAEVRPMDVPRLKEALGRLAGEGDSQDDGPPWRKVAAIAAARSSLCVITGGPGTGKTTLVCRILALLLEHAPGLKVRLAAPTGKAARRLAETVAHGLGSVDAPPEVLEKIPREAATIHRLLGYTASGRWRDKGRRACLDADVLVVDEASMADLFIAAALVRSLKKGSRLILLGDKNQLASVQAGYVLGDICDTGGVHVYSETFANEVRELTGHPIPGGGPPGMQDSIVELTRTYRFDPSSPIFKLAASVRQGDRDAAVRILGDPAGSTLSWRAPPAPRELAESLRGIAVRGFEPYLGAADPAERLRLFGSFRILCAVREGPYGVTAMNRAVERVLEDAGLIGAGSEYYDGRPVLITENDYTVGLFNGEVGVVAKDAHGTRVCFEGDDGRLKTVSPSRLPAHETAFAMTVHKSQGSEFDHVLVVLPERDSPLLTRELVYTALTRARKGVTLWAGGEIVGAAVSRTTRRVSGLRDRLWGGTGMCP
jgi:exodeoxyribonuclease V alpha subunit